MLTVPLLQRFLNYVDGERNFSAHTVRSYRADLNQFCLFLHAMRNDPRAIAGEMQAQDLQELADSFETAPANDWILAVSPAEVRAFLAMMHSSGYSKSTVARKLASLRSFYRYLVRNEWLEASPLSAVRTPRQDKKLPRFLDLPQIKALLGAPDQSTLLGSRDRAILETIYSAGLRIGELVALNLEDLDEFSDALRIRGKGKKERLAPPVSRFRNISPSQPRWPMTTSSRVLL
jgi:integrase/recombinase XerC